MLPIAVPDVVGGRVDDGTCVDPMYKIQVTSTCQVLDGIVSHAVVNVTILYYGMLYKNSC